MLKKVDGRAVLCCDLCRARMDVGPARKIELGLVRLPSGWLAIGPDRHQCSIHAIPEGAIYARID